MAMAMDMTTPISDIVESLRAIKVAASERHSALAQEMQELEAAFPDLAAPPRPRAAHNGDYKLSPQTRARMRASQQARHAKARAKANGSEAAVEHSDPGVTQELQ